MPQPARRCISIAGSHTFRYGHSWRSAAVAGLSAIGLDPPTGFVLM